MNIIELWDKPEPEPEEEESIEDFLRGIEEELGAPIRFACDPAETEA